MLTPECYMLNLLPGCLSTVGVNRSEYIEQVRAVMPGVGCAADEAEEGCAFPAEAFDEPARRHFLAAACASGPVGIRPPGGHDIQRPIASGGRVSRQVQRSAVSRGS